MCLLSHMSLCVSPRMSVRMPPAHIAMHVILLATIHLILYVAILYSYGLYGNGLYSYAIYSHGPICRYPLSPCRRPSHQSSCCHIYFAAAVRMSSRMSRHIASPLPPTHSCHRTAVWVHNYIGQNHTGQNSPTHSFHRTAICVHVTISVVEFGRVHVFGCAVPSRGVAPLLRSFQSTI